MLKLTLTDSWKEALGDEWKKPYFMEIENQLNLDLKAEKNVFPPKSQIFEAFELTPFEKVKVVILGQDPYHGMGQAMGLSFSVNRGVKVPPSLRNIYQELQSDLGLRIPDHGDLSSWAQQGVLLLNNVLTVTEGRAGSHHKIGWEKFTDKVIEVLNREKENLVFILWGSPAQKKASQVDPERHCILMSVHPSPLSSYRGFFGSKPFSECNKYLQIHKIRPIDWRIPL
jgi:uracil-DNA glycosylase